MLKYNHLMTSASIPVTMKQIICKDWYNRLLPTFNQLKTWNSCIAGHLNKSDTLSPIYLLTSFNLSTEILL